MLPRVTTTYSNLPTRHHSSQASSLRDIKASLINIIHNVRQHHIERYQGWIQYRGYGGRSPDLGAACYIGLGFDYLYETVKVRTILTHTCPYPQEHSRHAMIAVAIGCLFFISSDNIHTLIHKLDNNCDSGVADLLFGWKSAYSETGQKNISPFKSPNYFDKLSKALEFAVSEWILMFNFVWVRYFFRGLLFAAEFQIFEQSPEFLENLETKNIVLVHGEGFGAWYWYKTIALLEESGMVPTALDLTGSGDLSIGHSSGGACVSYAMERFQRKISKAVFLCGTMLSNGQKPFDVFVEQLGSSEFFMKESQFLIHGNGKDKPATGFMFEKQLMRGLYFNQSPAKDITLAMVSMRPVPLGPMMQNLSLSKEKYGAGRRFYIQTLDDYALSPDIQEKLVRENPPEGVFKIKGSDHCPFFSKPQSLHKILLEIAQIA
ncbi:hypothetical protein M8C21_016662 [Ambrosia artemisiifolia]|uniref:Uncharacterized protein n=1 Tax=Ambrosia artemisiifolia TaxID=4212 RepID=A0AAD5G5G1_AMBAR|nr:hypothetical protein M8C21_016662 [Ambrosia artemisiifolia]